MTFEICVEASIFGKLTAVSRTAKAKSEESEAASSRLVVCLSRRLLRRLSLCFARNCIRLANLADFEGPRNKRVFVFVANFVDGEKAGKVEKQKSCKTMEKPSDAINEKHEQRWDF